MRYQQLIYIQNATGVRNKDILNVNMSSDVCIFEAPIINISGASKIDCTIPRASYIIDNDNGFIPINILFTDNIDSFTGYNTTFKYEIYKFNNTANIFTTPPLYKSIEFSYDSLIDDGIYQQIPINALQIDGEYIIKPYYIFDKCTTYLSHLSNNKIDTSIFKNGKQFGIYDKDTDYYLSVIRKADTPLFLDNGTNNPPANQLFQQVILPTNGQTNLTITQTYVGFFVLTLNGLVLSANYDYTYTGNIITVNSELVSGDIVTVIYTTSGGNNLVGDNINITTPIVSGTTGGQGDNSAYFNTSTGKYEIYTNVTPSYGSTIIVMINGVTLTSGIDYYQSSSNSKRIILEGDLVIGDIITIVYFPITSTVNGLITNTPSISWEINNPPQKANGVFTLEVSNDKSFETILITKTQNYIIDNVYYYDTLTISGDVGTTLYYRVKNDKNYETICGDIITTTAYSEVLPITIQTNSINTY